MLITHPHKNQQPENAHIVDCRVSLHERSDSFDGSSAGTAMSASIKSGRAVRTDMSSLFSEQIKRGEDGLQAVVAPFRAERRAVRPVVCGKCQHLSKQRMVLQVDKFILSLHKRDL
jgi:hypothetical protein